MNQQNKKAFTLVELIVVITILAILGTIAFISLQGFSKDARNSSRASDLANIEKVLGLYQLREGNFPIPTNSVDITYSGATVWTQGTFGEETRKLLGSQGQISNVPLDPLTSNEYTYSILNTNNEYQAAGVFEGNYLSNNNILDETYAAGVYGTTKISGNYNGKVAKTQSGATTYVLALPSIISGDISLTNIVEILNTKKLVYNGYHSLPSSYSGTTLFVNEIIAGNLVNIGSFIVYEASDLRELINTNDPSYRVNMISNLQRAYSGTVVSINPEIYNIVNLDFGKSEDIVIFSANLVNNNFGGNISINKSLVGWRSLDKNCSIDDIHIPNGCVEGTTNCIIWAGCNSTLGTGEEFKYSSGDSCYNYLGSYNQSCSDIQNLSTSKEIDWNSTYGINNIWGKMYDENGHNLACPEGWHVASENDWGLTSKLLNGGVNCLDTSFDYFNSTLSCTGLGWFNHKLKNSTNNLVEALNVPLGGGVYQNYGGSIYRGLLGAYFLGNINSTYAKSIGFLAYHNSVSVDVGLISGSYLNVRCVKD